MNVTIPPEAVPLSRRAIPAGTLGPITLPASAQPTRNPRPAHPGAAAGPPPAAVSNRSPAGTGEKALRNEC